MPQGYCYTCLAIGGGSFGRVTKLVCVKYASNFQRAIVMHSSDHLPVPIFRVFFLGGGGNAWASSSIGSPWKRPCLLGLDGRNREMVIAEIRQNRYGELSLRFESPAFIGGHDISFEKKEISLHRPRVRCPARSKRAIGVHSCNIAFHMELRNGLRELTALAER